MDRYSLYGIQISDFLLFLSVVKYKSFAKASDEMFITPSSASKRIFLLEKKLGLTLFIRNSRGVELTSAGKDLADRLPGIISDLFNAISSAQISQDGKNQILRIAYLQWGDPVFIDMIKQFICQNPKYDIEIYGKSFKELHESLVTGSVDLIFTLSYDQSFDEKEYDVIQIQEVPLAVYVSEESSLSGKPFAEIEDLKNVPILLLNNDESYSYNQYVKSLFEKKHLQPLIGQYANSALNHMANVRLNKGVLFASEYFVPPKNIFQIPIKNESLYLVAIRKKTNNSLVLDEFLTYITDF